MKPLTPASPHAIIMVGIPGSGKSTFAEHFAETFHAPIINEARIAFEAGLDPERTDIVSHFLLTEILKANKTFLYEATDLTKAKRAEFTKTVIKAGYRPLLVWVQTEANEAKRRATKPQPTGSGLSDEEFDAAFYKFQAPGEQEKVVVISGKHTYASQLKIVLKQLAGSRPDTPINPPAPRTGNIVVR
ncbi:MAG: AAA family ATPase [Candidatus Microsaccharimonas sp.]